MSIKSAIPYLILSGRAREAIALYERALGARVENVQRFGDVDQSCPVAKKDLIMHAELRIGQAVVMLSDGPGEGPVPAGGAVSVALEWTDARAMREGFDALAAGGKVIQPLIAAHWGAMFGVVHDANGVSWMFTGPLAH
jgi:PhnB protein